MSVADVCNRNVVVIDRHSSVQEAARLMREHHVGDLIVVEKKAEKCVPVGILTDRDIVIELSASGLKVEDFIVADVMSDELITACQDDDLLDTIELMRTKAVRRIPVLDRAGSLIGIVTVDDVIDLLGEMLTDLSSLVTRQQQREQRLRS